LNLKHEYAILSFAVDTIGIIRSQTRRES